jgi:hypothetical protein
MLSISGDEYGIARAYFSAVAIHNYLPSSRQEVVHLCLNVLMPTWWFRCAHWDLGHSHREALCIGAVATK